MECGKEHCAVQILQVQNKIWAFRIKCFPNGDFDKFKACLVVRGDLQSDERETFAPVVKWSTIRTVLAFALKMGLKTRQIDLDNAFVQAESAGKDSIHCTLPVGGVLF